MRKRSDQSGLRQSYRWRTQRPLTCLVFLAPLLVLFQVGTLHYDTGLLAPKHLGQLLRSLGATGNYLPCLLVVVVLLLQHVLHRDKWRIRPRDLAGMLGESVIWAAPLVVLSQVMGELVAQVARDASEAGPLMRLEELLVAVGAGIYEEFLFRLVLISLVMLICVDVFGLRKDVVAAAAVLVGAALFSLYHLPVEQITGEEAFPWGTFLFRAAAGGYLGAMFVFRGFAIAVGGHIVYNVYVLLTS